MIIDDLIGLLDRKFENVKRLEDLDPKEGKRSKKMIERWKKVENYLINNGIASSLPVYLIYEYYLMKRNTSRIAEDLASKTGILLTRHNLHDIFRKLNILNFFSMLSF